RRGRGCFGLVLQRAQRSSLDDPRRRARADGNDEGDRGARRPRPRHGSALGGGRARAQAVLCRGNGLPSAVALQDHLLQHREGRPRALRIGAGPEAAAVWLDGGKAFADQTGLLDAPEGVTLTVRLRKLSDDPTYKPPVDAPPDPDAQEVEP